MRNAKFLLTAVMLVLASTVMAERGMVLLMKDNTKHSFAFVETPVVKVDKELTITTTNSEVKVQYADVQRIYFDEVGGVEDVVADNAAYPTYSINADGVTIKSLRPGDAVSVYTLDGRLVQGVRADAAGEASVKLAPGVPYAIRLASGFAFKVILKYYCPLNHKDVSPTS